MFVSAPSNLGWPDPLVWYYEYQHNVTTRLVVIYPCPCILLRRVSVVANAVRCQTKYIHNHILNPCYSMRKAHLFLVQPTHSDQFPTIPRDGQYHPFHVPFVAANWCGKNGDMQSMNKKHTSTRILSLIDEHRRTVPEGRMGLFSFALQWRIASRDNEW